MAKVTNIGKTEIGFKDDDKNIHSLKAGESIECNYSRSMDSRLQIGEVESPPPEKPKRKRGEI